VLYVASSRLLKTVNHDGAFVNPIDDDAGIASFLAVSLDADTARLIAFPGELPWHERKLEFQFQRPNSGVALLAPLAIDDVFRLGFPFVSFDTLP
jgi:hypothetical protein